MDLWLLILLSSLFLIAVLWLEEKFGGDDTGGPFLVPP